MTTRFVLLVALIAALLCGCDTYTYLLETVIFEDGSVERAIDFARQPYKATQDEAAQPAASVEVEGQSGEQPVTITLVEDNDAEPTGGDALAPQAPPEPLGFPPVFVMPDQRRFTTFELVENGLRGTWRSDGTIHSDVRWFTPSHSAEQVYSLKPSNPPTPEFFREAFNEGLVRLDDLVLIKTITYNEHFHDYYSGEEFDLYVDMIIDILADFVLDVLHEDFGNEYDFTRFDEFVNDVCVPLVKKWKRFYVMEDKYDDEPGEFSLAPDEFSRSIHAVEEVLLVIQLLQLGVELPLDFPDIDLEEYLEEWMAAKAHELVTRTADGAPWPKAEIEGYFYGEDEDISQSPFLESAERLAARRYGHPDFFVRHLLGLYSSFALTTDHHKFDVSLTLPWTVIRVAPQPNTHQPMENGSLVRWRFSQDDIFPDGVHLSLTCATPIEEAQKRVFGNAVLQTREELEDYLVLLQDFCRDDRDAILSKLRECVEERSLVPFQEYARDLLPEEWSPEADEQPPIGTLLLLLEGLAAD